MSAWMRSPTPRSPQRRSTSMFQRSRVGRRPHLQTHGIDDGLPAHRAGARVPINVHADEFNELMGDEFVPLINKAAAWPASHRVHADPLRTSRPASANRAKAGQVIGNFNNLFMLQGQETGHGRTADRQLPKVEVYTTTIVRRATDSSDIRGATDFTSQHAGPHQQSSVPMIEPSHVVGCPKASASRRCRAASFGRCACRCRRRTRTK